MSEIASQCSFENNEIFILTKRVLRTTCPSGPGFFIWGRFYGQNFFSHRRTNKATCVKRLTVERKRVKDILVFLAIL